MQPGGLRKPLLVDTLWSSFCLTSTPETKSLTSTPRMHPRYPFTGLLPSTYPAPCYPAPCYPPIGLTLPLPPTAAFGKGASDDMTAAKEVLYTQVRLIVLLGCTANCWDFLAMQASSPPLRRPSPLSPPPPASNPPLPSLSAAHLGRLQEQRPGPAHHRHQLGSAQPHAQVGMDKGWSTTPVNKFTHNLAILACRV